MKKVINKSENSIVITRSKSNGKYSYYLTLISKGLFNSKFINESYKQKNEINSLKGAINEANKILSSYE